MELEVHRVGHLVVHEAVPIYLYLLLLQLLALHLHSAQRTCTHSTFLLSMHHSTSHLLRLWQLHEQMRHTFSHILKFHMYIEMVLISARDS